MEPPAIDHQSRYGRVPDWVLVADISSQSVRVFGVLAAYYADRDGRCWPKRRAVAEKARCSETSLDRSLTELRRIGAVTSETRQMPSGDFTSSIYQLHFIQRKGLRGVTTGGDTHYSGVTRGVTTGGYTLSPRADTRIPTRGEAVTKPMYPDPIEPNTFPPYPPLAPTTAAPTPFTERWADEAKGGSRGCTHDPSCTPRIERLPKLAATGKSRHLDDGKRERTA